MELLDILNIILIFLTVMVGSYGTYYDLKKEGKLTKHGWICLILLTLLATGSIAVYFQKRSNERQKNIEAKENADEARKLLEGAKNELELMSENFKKQQKQESEFWIESSSKLSSLINGNENSARQISRLLYPLDKMSFSYSFVYRNASNKFPSYYLRLKEAFLKCINHECKGATAVSKEFSDSGKDIMIIEAESEFQPLPEETEAYYEFNRSEDRIVFYGGDKQKNDMENLLRKNSIDLKMELSISGNLSKNSIDENQRISPVSRPPFHELYINFSKNIIRHEISFAKIRVMNDSGRYISILDITQPKNDGNQYFEMRVQSYVKDAELEELTVHFGESYKHGIKLKSKFLKRFVRAEVMGVSDISFYGNLLKLVY